MTNTQIRRRGVHASAVGHGVAHAIFATDAEPRTAEDWVHLCMTAADEAEAAVADAPPDPDDRPGLRSIIGFLNETREDGDPVFAVDRAHRTAAMIEAGAAAFAACMPKLTGRRNTQAYVACIAVGLQRRYFTGAETKAMLYTVQLALSAHPTRRAKRGRRAQ